MNCYNCHKCESQYFILLHLEDDTTLNITITPDFQQIESSDDIPQISMHAMLSHNNPKALRIKGKIKNHDITILIDSGSTHNLIQKRIALLLNLHISPSH